MWLQSWRSQYWWAPCGIGPEGHNITIAFLLGRELHWACRRTKVKLDKAWWMKNLLTQWETKEENLKINLMKNLLTQWETEEENQTTGGDVLLIDREHRGNMLLINRKLAELEDDAECASLPKFTELMKKPPNLTRTGKEKPETLDVLNLLALAGTLRKIWKINECVGEKPLNLMRKLEKKIKWFWKGDPSDPRRCRVSSLIVERMQAMRGEKLYSAL